MKRCKLIQRRIDRAKDASPDSHRRTFDWLFGKIKTALWEMREDQNEESIKHALSPSKTQRDRRQAKGATVGEEKGSELSKAMPASKAKAKPSQPAKGDGKGKGKGDQASKGPPPVSKAQPNVAKAKASADPKGKPSVPCFFFQGYMQSWSRMSFCTRGSDTSSQGEGPAPAAKATVATVLASSASQAAGAPTSHASAFVSTLRCAFAPFRFLLSVFAAISSSVIPEIGTGACTSGASLSPEVCQIGVPAVLSHQRAMIAQNNSEGVYQLEWIADSGAGRDLASFQAFEAQGVPTSVSQRAASSEGSVRFETGNGHVTSDAVVHANGNQVGKASFRTLDACPLVRSLGHFLNQVCRSYGCLVNYHFWVPTRIQFK